MTCPYSCSECGWGGGYIPDGGGPTLNLEAPKKDVRQLDVHYYPCQGEIATDSTSENRVRLTGLCQSCF